MSPKPLFIYRRFGLSVVDIDISISFAPSIMKISAGKLLFLLRKEHRFSQQYLSNYLSVSRPTYERYEKDVVEIPLSKLCLLAGLYEIEQLILLNMVINTASPISIKYVNEEALIQPLETDYLLAKCD